MTGEGKALVLRGDALHLPIPDNSVDLIITSPPYFALRSYRDEGEHYSGQIGSEVTPQAFLEALWAATAEMVRVLKPTGSMFINLGDSYQGSGGYNNAAIGAGGRGPDRYTKAKWGVSEEGRPCEWTNSTAAWLAAVLDCEGSISGRIFTNSSGGESFVVWMRVGMMRREVVDRIAEITGVGRVFTDKRGVHNWHVASQQARYVLERIWPWLRIKQKQALTAIELCRHVEQRSARGSWRPLTQDDIAYRQRLIQAIRDGNKGRPNDYEPPLIEKIPLPDTPWVRREKSLRGLPWEYALGCINGRGVMPPLILRSEIIWSKPNGL